MLLVLVLTMLLCTNRSTREGVGSLTTTQTQSYPIHIARDSLIFFKAFSSFFGCVALLLFGFCLFYYPLKFKIHHRHLRCQFNQLRSCSFVSICFADFFLQQHVNYMYFKIPVEGPNLSVVRGSSRVSWTTTPSHNFQV